MRCCSSEVNVSKVKTKERKEKHVGDETLCALREKHSNYFDSFIGFNNFCNNTVIFYVMAWGPVWPGFCFLLSGNYLCLVITGECLHLFKGLKNLFSSQDVSLSILLSLSLPQPERLVSFTHPTLFSFNCVALILCLCHMSYGNTHRFVCFWLSFELKFLFCCGSPCFAQNEPHLTSINSLSTEES